MYKNIEEVMKFKITTENLKSGLSKVFPVIPPKSTLPALECVLFKLDQPSTLLLQGTDDGISIKAKCTIAPEDIIEIKEGEEDGFFVHALRLKNLVEALPECVLEITHADNTVIFKSETGKYKLQTLPADEKVDDTFELEAVGTVGEAIEIDEEFRTAITKPMFCVSKDQFRLAMTGICLDFKKNIVASTGTDSFRLLRKHLRKPANAPEDLQIILPVRVAKLIGSANLDGLTIQIISREETFAETTTRRDVGIKIHNLEFDAVATLINEKYPNVESVIPQDNKNCVMVGLNDLRASLKRVNLFTSATTNHVAIDITEDGIIIEGMDAGTNSKAREILRCTKNFPLKNGEHLRVGFNILYLRQALDNIGTSPAVTLGISENIRPILLYTQDNQLTEINLLMPVRLAE